MTWTATKDAAYFEAGTLFQRVTFTDGVQVFSETYRSIRPAPDWPDPEIFSRLDALNTFDTSNLKPGAPTEKPVAPITEPTPEELERQAFFTDYNVERTNQILATLTPELAARYKPEYGPLR